MYSPQLLDHFQNPRNVGDLVDADATAEIENPACGDVLRISLKASSGQIIQVRFKAKGCVAAIACASAITEMVAGRAVEAAKRLQPEDVNQAVGGLPQASTHAAHLAIEALALALSRLGS